MLLKDRWYDYPPTDRWETQYLHDTLLYREPEADEITNLQKDWIRDYINDFERVLTTPCPNRSPCSEHPITGYVDFLDVDSFIDHHLLLEMARNVDGFVLSTFLHKDREDKLKMGPIWDFNGSLGNADYFCAWETEGWHHEFQEWQCGGGFGSFPPGNSKAYEWYDRLWRDPDHKLQYADRWFALRDDLLSTARLHQAIDEVADLLTDGGAPNNPVDRNFQRWDVLYEYVWPNKFCCGSYAEHVSYMKDWLAARLDWMDAEISTHYGADCPIQVLPSGQPQTIERGQTLRFTATAYNPCFQSRSFDRAVLHVGPPANLNIVLYDGGAVHVASGGSRSAAVQLDVPMQAPFSDYVVDVELYRNGVLQNLGSFAISVIPQG